MKKTRVPLPQTALDYLGSGKTTPVYARSILARLHVWAEHQGLNVEEFGAGHLERFLTDTQRGVAYVTRQKYRSCIRDYLLWLAERRRVTLDIEAWKHPRRKALPDEAERFLGFLEPTRRRATCAVYRYALNRLYEWAEQSNVTISTIIRADIGKWLRHLHHLKLAASTRQRHVICVRVYFDFLYENGLLDTDPALLIKAADFPRTPRYLPRALKPEVDRQLCERLRGSERPLWLGLLIMRRAGLRVGELRSLPYDCIHPDPHGNHYIKVPLGKLNNERLVPIDDDTHTLIEKLQNRDPRPRNWLLENRNRRQVPYARFRESLFDAVTGLQDLEPEVITTHRLRHTYATEMVNAGMPLACLQQLLGHISVTMTLRYAAVDLDTIRTEYNEALRKAAQRYGPMPVKSTTGTQDRPSQMVDDAVRLLHRDQDDHPESTRTVRQRLAKRLTRIRSELDTIGS